MTNPQIHLYIGNGKGKTSILVGSVIRALGNDLNVAMFRFLKNRFSGEIEFLKKIKDFKIFNYYNFSKKFFIQMNDDEKEILSKEVKEGLQQLHKAIASQKFDLIIVDELLDCVDNGIISDEDIIRSVKLKGNKKTELMLSGHNASDKLIKMADLVSDVKKIKHYYDKNIIARDGIET